MRVTYRWKDFVLKGMQMHDLIELDNRYYFCDLHWFPNAVIEERAKENPEWLYTLEQLLSRKASHPDLRLMYEAAMTRNVPCECGADKTNTTHSTWCPRYE